MLFDHVDMRVRDLARTRPLYDALLPQMGYSEINADEESAGYHRPDDTSGAQPFVWLAQDSNHTPNGTRIAFAASSRADVDRFARIAEAAGARQFEGPQLIREYGPHYYAAFFEDPEGNKIEICCRKPE